MKSPEQDHLLEVINPGRPGVGSVTGVCSCKLWQQHALIESAGGKFDEATSLQWVKDAFAAHLRDEVPELRRQEAAHRQREQLNARASKRVSREEALA